MVTFVLGLSGSGKTKWLINEANKEMQSGNGNIIFIDSDNEHIFTLDHDVRLVDASEYQINNLDKFYGFVAGIISSDFDIEKIYIDGAYNLLDLNSEENLADLTHMLAVLSEENEVNIFVGLDQTKDAFPSDDRIDFIELSAD